MAIKVGRWDCPVCETKGILGPEKHCTNCGSPRPQNVKFYLADDSEIVQDEKRINEAKSGADWVCSYCSAHNKAGVSNCHSCGNDREVNDGDKSLEQKIIYTDGRKNPQKEASKLDKKPQDPLQTKPQAKKVSKGAKFGCLSIVISAILLMIASMFTTDIQVSVDSFEWEREITVEKYAEVTESDWRVPEGGKQTKSFEAVHHYDQVADGTETKTRTVEEQTGTKKVKVGTKDLGNGYFEDVYEDQPVYTSREETYTETKYKKVPVYKTKYEYTIFRWTEEGVYKTSKPDKNPFWSDKAHIGEENYREKSKKEKYLVYVKDEGGEIHKVEVNFEKWENLKKGDQLEAQISTVFRTFLGLKDK